MNTSVYSSQSGSSITGDHEGELELHLIPSHTEVRRLRPEVSPNRVLRTIRKKSHWALTLLVLMALIPALKSVHLPVSLNWGRLVRLYWIGFALRSVFAAAVLACIGLPASATVLPVWAHFARQKTRLLIFVPFVFWAFWQLSFFLGLVWICLALVATELLDRSYENPKAVSKSIKQLMAPALYLFIGLILVFAYNDIIVAAEKPAAYDWLFLRLDSYLLHGRTISGVVRNASGLLSARTFGFAEGVYYTMFEQVGAALIIVSICQGMRRGMRLVGTLLTAYYLALLVFYLWPSMGPFYTCVEHFNHFPFWLKTYDYQRNIISNASLLSGQARSLNRIGTDYFIAFPSLHAADPIIVLWFMRKWKRIKYCLIVHDILLVPAILLLEWHYLVDLIGGAALAGIAIWLNNPREEQPVVEEQPEVSLALKQEELPVCPVEA